MVDSYVGLGSFVTVTYESYILFLCWSVLGHNLTRPLWDSLTIFQHHCPQSGGPSESMILELLASI